jgi:aryl-alcohol dehydrogenase-like predicted oxidoreductase
MDYVNFGSTGLKVSRICLGCMSFGASNAGTHNWVLSEENSRPIIKRALDLGINFFDTANAYSLGASEEILGRALNDFVPREQVVVATKVHAKMRNDPNGRGLSRKAILHEVDASLQRLGMDYIDVYQIHRWDDETPVEETLETLNDIVRSGKVRYLGASSMWAWQFMKALGIQRANRWAPFVSMQNHLNLLYREEEREMLPLCHSEGIAVMPWSPLARGRLTRPWTTDAPTTRAATDRFAKMLYSAAEDSDRDVIERVGEIADKRGVPRAQVAMAWLLHKPEVTCPITGVTKMSQLEDAVAATQLTLSAEEILRLEELYVPHSPVGYQLPR